MPGIPLIAPLRQESQPIWGRIAGIIVDTLGYSSGAFSGDARRMECSGVFSQLFTLGEV